MENYEKAQTIYTKYCSYALDIITIMRYMVFINKEGLLRACIHVCNYVDSIYNTSIWKGYKQCTVTMVIIASSKSSKSHSHLTADDKMANIITSQASTTYTVTFTICSEWYTKYQSLTQLRKVGDFPLPSQELTNYIFTLDFLLDTIDLIIYHCAEPLFL